MEAGFQGVLNCVNDPLGLNREFADGRDLVLLDLDVERSVARLREFLDAPEKLYDLAHNNWLRFREVFNVDNQLWRRTQIVMHELLKRYALEAESRESKDQAILSARCAELETATAKLTAHCRWLEQEREAWETAGRQKAPVFYGIKTGYRRVRHWLSGKHR